MTEFENLKNSYISAMNVGILGRLDTASLKYGNEILSYFCKQLISDSQYSATEKENMKNQIDLLKQSIDKEIESSCH